MATEGELAYLYPAAPAPSLPSAPPAQAREAPPREGRSTSEVACGLGAILDDQESDQEEAIEAGFHPAAAGEGRDDGGGSACGEAEA
mmetsp:Transcript_93426/g.302469  ORF Transcript_93426/g.302469 Transcript_93426/m.302469 type:complete len:87 (-) Transcript_93426:118-378(-)